MVTLARIAIAVAVVVLSLAASAQQKPSFSGRWVVVSPEKGAGREQVVKHDDKSLSVEVVAKGLSRRMHYQLDGVERRISIPGSNADVTMLASAAWDGTRIVITTRTSYSNGMKTVSKDTWSLDAKGQLVIEYTESGPTGPGPGMKVIHVKKP